MVISRGFVGAVDYCHCYPMSGEWYQINQINLSTTATGGVFSQLEVVQLRNHQHYSSHPISPAGSQLVCGS